MGVNADLSLSLHHASQQKLLLSLFSAFVDKCRKHFGDDLTQSEKRKKLHDFSVSLEQLQERVQEANGKSLSAPVLPELAPNPAGRRRCGGASTSELPSIEGEEVQAGQSLQRGVRWKDSVPKRSQRVSPRELQRIAVEFQQEFRRCTSECSSSSSSDGDLEESSSESDESLHEAGSREQNQLETITEEPSAPEYHSSEASIDVAPPGVPSTRLRPRRHLRREDFHTA
eukprot:TRINITY_DN8043_c0_g1_i1.p1 TRINITY_DN8043_c0_g1~~TRINITY_DN8043_c0_g1_i1.p1  ORF type:complete len:264 (+),score=36.18 TRINITY_DN8043_c0_g1_i1:109-792(+)